MMLDGYTMLNKSGLLSLLVLVACDDGDTPKPAPEPPPIPQDIFATPGQIVPYATAEQRATFERGERVAMHQFTPSEGLGPKFNVTFCAGCHEKPVFGGGAGHYRDFYLAGQALDDGTFIPDGDRGGVLTSFMADGSPRPQPGPRANVFAVRNPIPFFGVGLIAELDEDAILANADPDDLDGDGISGRANYDRGFVGRFGMKAQTVDIEGFIRGPINNHVGITSDPLTADERARLPVAVVAFEDEAQLGESELGLRTQTFHQAAAPAEPLTDSDDVSDPEMLSDDLFDLVSWSMLLGAPRPGPSTAETEAGGALFADFNCAGCHVPTLASFRGSIPLYSDLLLHDMGPELADGIVMGVAKASEFRTSPLWGVGATGPYLHDGRAFTLASAIEMHGGEASASRDAYLEASASEQAQVVAFLENLGGAEVKTAGRVLPTDAIPGVGELGGPLRALSADENAQWLAGRAVFDRDHGMQDGLGPFFNGDSCRACHFEPMIGGAGPLGVNVTRAGRMDGDDFTTIPTGSIIHRFNAAGARPEAPEDFTIFELRQTPTTFGIGIIDGLSEEAILANADPDDVDGDGITGVAHVLADGRIGRFGWKAQIPSTMEFIGDAMIAELGFTMPAELDLAFARSTDDDDVPDPELSLAEANALEFFMNQQSPGAAEDHPTGASAFERIGCDGCHIAHLDGMQGGPAAYTDLLLHDVASPAGVPDGDASTTQFRTPPLWGIGTTGPYMHDGHAETLEAAIEAHAGEAEASVTAYQALQPGMRSELLRFLRGL